MTSVYILSVAVIGVATIKLLTLIGRSREGEFRVSDAWLDEHIRGRRD